MAAVSGKRRFFDNAQFGARGSGIVRHFLRQGAHGLFGQDARFWKVTAYATRHMARAQTALRPITHSAFDHAIFQGMERDDGKPAPAA